MNRPSLQYKLALRWKHSANVVDGRRSKGSRTRKDLCSCITRLPAEDRAGKLMQLVGI